MSIRFAAHRRAHAAIATVSPCALRTEASTSIRPPIRVETSPVPVRSPPVLATLVLWLLALASAAVAQPPFDLDTADAETLAATLPGIGPVKARRIVEHRERHGAFDDLDALQAVKGIGPATVERIRAHLSDRSARLAPGPSAARSGARSADAEPRSTTELERATRRAVRDIVVGARRDAAQALADDAR